MRRPRRLLARRRVGRRGGCVQRDATLARAIDQAASRPGATECVRCILGQSTRAYGTNAVASISTFASFSMSATTCTTLMTGKCLPITAR